MNNMEYIEDYFNGIKTDEQKQEFEQRVVNDVSFAEDVAFYISTNAAIKEKLRQQKKERFREVYNQTKVISIAERPVNRIWRYAAAKHSSIVRIFIVVFIEYKLLRSAIGG